MQCSCCSLPSMLNTATKFISHKFNSLLSLFSLSLYWIAHVRFVITMQKTLVCPAEIDNNLNVESKMEIQLWALFAMVYGQTALQCGLSIQRVHSYLSYHSK